MTFVLRMYEDTWHLQVCKSCILCNEETCIVLYLHQGETLANLKNTGILCRCSLRPGNPHILFVRERETPPQIKYGMLLNKPKFPRLIGHLQEVGLDGCTNVILLTLALATTGSKLFASGFLLLIQLILSLHSGYQVQL